MDRGARVQRGQRWARSALRAMVAVTAVGTLLAGALVTPARPAQATVTPIRTSNNYYHTCTTGTRLFGGGAICWGKNADGELGTGTTTDSATPVAVDTSGVLDGLTITQV